MIYLLIATGLTPGGSSTVHIYTQTIHRTTQLKQTVHRTTQIYLSNINSINSYLHLKFSFVGLYSLYL